MSKTVLAIDNTPEVRHFLGKALGQIGSVVCFTAKDAEDGTQILNEVFLEKGLVPNLIIFEVDPLDKNSFEFIKRTKNKHPQIENVPVILTIADEALKERISKTIIGPVKILVKPFALKELEEVVIDALTGPPKEE